MSTLNRILVDNFNLMLGEIRLDHEKLILVIPFFSKRNFPSVEENLDQVVLGFFVHVQKPRVENSNSSLFGEIAVER